MRVRKAPKRASATAARRPSAVAIVAEIAAAAKLIFADWISSSLSSKATYHFVEKPPHTETRRDALKLIAANIAIGA